MCPPVVRLTIFSLLAIICLPFAFTIALVLSSFAFRVKGLGTFGLCALLLIAFFLTAARLNMSFDAAVVAR